MRESGLGVSEEDYNAFANYAPGRLSGRILLRVEADGEAYYVNPDNLRMHYLGRPADAFRIMGGLGLGITNADLKKVPTTTSERRIVICHYPPDDPGNWHTDEFICPEGKRLKMKITNRDKNGKILNQRYFCEHGNNCLKKAECAGKAKKKQLRIDWKLEGYKAKTRKKLNTREGKRKYLERMSEVEPVFGNIKYNQKSENFLCRGRPMVKIEFGLACTAHNFVKIANWLKQEANRRQFDILMRRRAGV